MWSHLFLKKTPRSQQTTEQSLSKYSVCVPSLSHVRLCGLTECSLAGSSMYGIFPARILEWVDISSPRGSSQPRDQIPISCSSCSGRQIDHLETPPETLESTKKGSPASKEKKKPQQDGKSGAITVKLNPVSARWAPHKPENNSTTEVIPQQRNSWVPYQASQLGGSGNGRKSPQRVWLWRPMGFDPGTSTGLRETETPLLEGAHNSHLY